jgi:hypothetical protein
MALSSDKVVRDESNNREARQQMDIRPLLRCTSQPSMHVGESIHNMLRIVSMVR